VAANLFPAPAAAIIAAVFLIMTVSYCQLRVIIAKSLSVFCNIIRTPLH